jgi:DNA-binding PadR family transcriptional regulator
MNDLILLAALMGGPAYGYALKKTAGLIFGHAALHNNIVYPSLQRFVRQGWVDLTIVPGDRGQRRKQYRITAAGKQHLRNELTAFSEQQAGDEMAFLLRVAFFDGLSPKPRARIIAARKSFLAARAAELVQLQGLARPRSFSRVAVERVQQRIGDELRWIRRIEHKLEGKTGG